MEIKGFFTRWGLSKMPVDALFRLAYDMGKSKGIEIGREQVLNENLIRLEKQLANVERDLTNGHELLSER